jgi:hypothetical protein
MFKQLLSRRRPPRPRDARVVVDRRLAPMPRIRYYS